MATSFDYIVVGAGAAGCVLAGRLAARPDLRVALIEAGGRDTAPLLKIPGLGFLIASTPKYNWNFETDPIPDLDNRSLTLLQGKVMGGSSSINGMIYTRGHSREYDIWRQMGCEGWGADDVMPYFKRSEGNSRGASAWHGGSGPLKVRPTKLHLPIIDAFLEAAGKSGYPIVDDLNRDIVDGFGYYDCNIDRGRRVSAAKAYVRASEGRQNFQVLTRTMVRRVVVENGRAVGVEIDQDGSAIVLRADREIILCGGGIKSPQMLMLSGIGPADDLRRLGIDVVADSPNVGQNLQNHASYRPQYATTAEMGALRYLRPKNAIGAALNYAFTGGGPLAESFATAGGFFRTDTSAEIPDIQVIILGTLLPKPGSSTLRSVLPKEHGFAMTVYQGTPYSRGEVRLRSANPVEPPQILPRYFSDPRDMEVLLQGVERMREVVAHPAISRFVTAEVEPGTPVADRAALEAKIRSGASTSYHQSGTCAMGGNADSVLDTSLRVRGVEGLRVADASVMPRIPNAGLHAPTIMVGEKAAAMILEAG